MADLSQSDVQRAVQDATKDLQREVMNISQHVSGLESLKSDVNNVLSDVRSMEANILTAKQGTNDLLNALGTIDQRLANVEAIMQRFDQRLQILEQSHQGIQRSLQ